MSHRKQHGVVYTPPSVARRILDFTLDDRLADVRVCDPACGDGAILAEFAKRVIAGLPRAAARRILERTAGFDIDPDALAACRDRLAHIAKEAGWRTPPQVRLEQRDALSRREWIDDFGAFTHVVGNPPYVRVQHLGSERRKLAFRNWQGTSGATDLFHVFFELGFDLLAKEGRLGFITPSSWLHAAAARAVRRMFLEDHTLLSVHDYGTEQMFEGVTTYTAITVAQKGRQHRHQQQQQKPVCYARTGGRWTNGHCLETKPADPTGQWWLVSPAARRQLRSLRRTGTPLRDLADIHVGLQTLADDVFVLERTAPHCETVTAMARDGSRVSLETSAVRRILKASRMHNGRDPKDRVVIYPYGPDGNLVPWDEWRRRHPLAAAWLVENRPRLLARDKGRTDPATWWGYGRRVSILSGFGKKILTPSLAVRPEFQLVTDRDSTFYSGYSVVPKKGVNIKWLLAQLNSPDMEFYMKQTAKQFRNGWFSFAKSYISDFPVVGRNQPASVALKEKQTFPLGRELPDVGLFLCEVKFRGKFCRNFSHSGVSPSASALM